MNTAFTAPPSLALILPCYNEEDALPETSQIILDLLNSLIKAGKIAAQSFALFVDDGSKDNTWSIIQSLTQKNVLLHGLKLAGNAGHQNALLAGMLSVKDIVDCAITLDADLQDDTNVIVDMIEAYTKGNHIVYGVRENRDSDSFFKRYTANIFYGLMSLMGAASIPNHADFRLVSKFTMHALGQYSERNLFLRTLFPAMNLRSDKVFYTRKEREHGETKYPLRKMISFALQGIANSSVFPLRLSAILGLSTLLFSLILTIFSLHSYFLGNALPGWTSLIVAVLYLGSVQLLCIAILGEYVAKLFSEVKYRPRYLIETTTLTNDYS